MKNIKLIISLFIAVLLMGCEGDESSSTFADGVDAPKNISALLTITQDNSGLVTIAPNGEGVTAFEVSFGDATEAPAMVDLGGKINHVYAEGVYTVKVTGVAINGKKTTVEVPLTVTFVAPVNLDVAITTVVGNPYDINVVAKADLETFFSVSWGEDLIAEPEQFNEGTAMIHTYANTGTYTITVVAYSGGAATTTFTQEVIISNPLALPINFEVGNYNFGNFGNAVATTVANPDPSGINTSAKVAKQTKNPGSEIWAGSLLTLDTPINNLATMKYFRVKVWSPAAGVTFKLKLESLPDTSVNFEADAVTTVANQWEELVYNFSGANATASYSNVVMFCNYGVQGDGTSYYFDDIVQASSGGSVGFPLTFEDSSATYLFNDFGNAYGSKVANPDASGINTSSNVGRYFKNSGSETWAGVAMPMTNPIDFSTMQKVKVKVWSPRAGVVVLLKFENINPAHNTALDIERQATTTVAGGWEELTYDFAGINNANNYQMAVLFFDFNVRGANEAFYFDDIKLSN
jgi:hypothetical protein